MRAITRVVRQICLLAENDREGEASRVTAAVLEPLIGKYREAHGAGALPDERIREIQSHEQERARDAAALGEMLFPLLAEHLDALRRAPAPPGPAPSAQGGAAGSARIRPSISPEIADLLDGMLAQDDSRPPSRPRRAQPRISATPGPKPTNPNSNP